MALSDTEKMTAYITVKYHSGCFSRTLRATRSSLREKELSYQPARIGQVV